MSSATKISHLSHNDISATTTSQPHRHVISQEKATERDFKREQQKETATLDPKSETVTVVKTYAASKTAAYGLRARQSECVCVRERERERERDLLLRHEGSNHYIHTGAADIVVGKARCHVMPDMMLAEKFKERGAAQGREDARWQSY